MNPREEYNRLRDEITHAKETGRNTKELQRALIEAAKQVGRKKTRAPRVCITC